mgnify:FL=1
MDSRSTIDSLSYTNFIGYGKGTKPLEEWLNLEDSINEVPKVRLAHPHTSIGHEGTRKRKREIEMTGKKHGQTETENARKDEI